MANLRVYDPFADMALDDMFKGFVRPWRVEGAVQPTMKIDVKEDDGGYVVHAEIPGVKKDDIHVNIEGALVTISAEVKQSTEKKEGERVLRTERYYGNVSRSFSLPVDIDQTASEAKYDNGVLELKLVKRAAAGGRKLAVQ